MKHKLKIKRQGMYLILVTLIAIALAVFIFKSIPQSNQQKTLTLIEDSDLRTGPSAFYPVIFNSKKGTSFKILEQQGKWLFVENKNHAKGWIAGWHTNLNIKEDVSPIQKPLQGKVILLDPGHGGNDVGASSKDGTLEKEVTLNTALLLEKKLKKEGAIVHMTRRTDEYVTLDDRARKADAFISIHSDALKDSEPHGLTVYYSHKSQKSLANTLHFAIKKKALLSDRGIRQENYQVIYQTKDPAVLLELGYISNRTDEYMMNNEVYRNIVTTSIVDGLKSYFLYSS